MKGFKRVITISIAVMMSLLALTGCGGSKPAEPKPATSAGPKIVLKASTAIGEKVADNKGFFMLIDRVNKELGDRLEIKYLGGPEVVPSFEIGEAVRKGVVDIAATPMNYYAPQLAVADAMKLNQFTPSESRQKGTWDVLDKLHAEKMNAKFLGDFDGHQEFRLYTNFPVQKLDDFKGKVIRTSRVYVQLVEALGAKPVVMAPGDIYSALERKVVDGFGWSSVGVADSKWHEVTKYRIEPGFYNADVVAFMNLDSWKKIPPDVQQAFMKIVAEVEKQADEFFEEEAKRTTDAITKGGMQTLTLPADVGKEYVRLAYEEGWKAVIKADPQNGPELRKLMSK